MGAFVLYVFVSQNLTFFFACVTFCFGGDFMYEKNLSEDLRLRLSSDDMSFLRRLSAERSVSVSSVIRQMIGEYRRSLDTLAVLRKAAILFEEENNDIGGCPDGDTKTDIYDQL